MNEVKLYDNTIKWEYVPNEKPKDSDSWLITRIFKLLLNILTFLPRWGINTLTSYMIVPSQMVNSRIFRIVDILMFGSPRYFVAPPYHKLKNACNRNRCENFDIQLVELKTPSGNTIRGTLLESRLASKNQTNVPTVICFCPNSRTVTNWGSDMHDPSDYVEKAAKLGYAVNVLMLDYPGVGESDGLAFAPYMREMVETMYNYLLDSRKVDRNNIHLHGYSLGSFMAAYLANYDKSSEGLIFLDRGGKSIVESASELAQMFINSLRKIPVIGHILALPPVILQSMLGIAAKIGGWDAFNTADNLRDTKRKIFAFYSPEDEVFTGSASYEKAFKDWKVNLIELHANEKKGVYHHGEPLESSHGITKTGQRINDLIGHNVLQIIDKSYGKSFFSWRSTANTSTPVEPSISTALHMLGSEVFKNGFSFFS